MKNKTLPYVVPVVFLYLCISFVTFNQIEEDAFIYFRFAANIANGHGYVFNAGGEHIEAGSGLLWLLLLVPVYKLFPNDMLFAAKMLGIFFGCGCLYLTWRISVLYVKNRFLACMPAVFLAISYPFYCWAQNGLETPAHLFALLLFFFFCVHEPCKRYWFVPAFLVFCARPEGGYFLLFLLPFLIMERKRIHNFAGGLSVFAALCCAVTAWRFFYFHELVPQTFYNKMDPSLRFAPVAVNKLFLHGYYLWLVIPALPLLVRRHFYTRKTVYLMLFFALALVWALVTAEFRILNRHSVPFLPFLFILLVCALSQYAAHAKLRNIVYGYVVAAALAILFLSRYALLEQVLPNPFVLNLQAAIVDPHRYLDDFRKIASGRQPGPCTGAYSAMSIGTNYQALVGRFIQANCPGTITIVYDQMGQTPWYGGLEKTFVDAFGLTDKTIGYFGFYERKHFSRLYMLYYRLMEKAEAAFWSEHKRIETANGILDYIFSKNPEVIMINKFVAQTFPASIPSLLEKHDRLRTHYTHVCVLHHTVAVYARNTFELKKPLTIPEGLVVQHM